VFEPRLRMPLVRPRATSRSAPRRAGRAASLLAVAASCSLLLAAGAATAQTRYVAFGDSITEGVGDASGLGYPPRLEDLLQGSDPGATVENAGVAGETTAEGLARVDSVLTGPPGVLLVMEGTNDVSRSISAETALFNLESIAGRAEDQGWGVIHATTIPRRPEGSTAREIGLNGFLNRLLRDSAGGSGAELADPFEVFGAIPDVFDTYYTTDPEDQVGHLSGDGYQVMAQVFRDVIRGVDSVPPVAGIIRPAPDAEMVPADIVIEVDLWDFGTGVDELNTTLLLDDVEVPAEITGGGRSAAIRYDPPEPLSGTVDVRLRSRDLASPVNTVDRTIARYVIEGSGGPLQGDLDGSGRIDGVDLVRFARRFGAVSGDERYAAEADFDGNGAIDGADLAVLASNFGETV